MSNNKKFCFFGHVDCGKSTFAGHLYYKLGGIDQHEFDRIKDGCTSKQKSHIFSRIFDVNAEEQERSKTHEYTFYDLLYNNVTYTIIDTPGHASFAGSLIKGLFRFSNDNIIGVLIISARKGEFEAGWKGGQTKEDIILTRAVGIKKFIILINKMDTCDWNQERYNNITSIVSAFLKKCHIKHYNYIPVSGYDGIGINSLDNMPEWYNGNCFLDTLDSIEMKMNQVIPFSTKQWNIMQCMINIVWSPYIITKGFSCLLHYEEEEYDVTFIKITNKNMKNKEMAKEGDQISCIIKSNDLIVSQLDCNKVILRHFGSGSTLNEFKTIGFGIIMNVATK